MTPEQFEAQARLYEMKRQRDAALNDCVDFSTRLAVAGQKIGELQAVIQSLEQQVEQFKTQIPQDKPQEGS